MQPCYLPGLLLRTFAPVSISPAHGRPQEVGTAISLTSQVVITEAQRHAGTCPRSHSW